MIYVIIQAKHGMQTQGLFYTVPPEDFSRWLSQGMHPHFYNMVG